MHKNKRYFIYYLIHILNFLSFGLVGQENELNSVQHATDSIWSVKAKQFDFELKEALRIDEKTAITRAFLNLGELHLQQKSSLINYDQGKFYLSEALRTVNPKDSLLLAKCYERLGDYSRFTASTIDAIQYYDKAFIFYHAMNNLDKCGTVLHRKGDCILDQKNYVLAKQNYTDAISFYERSNNKDMLASCISNIGEIYEREGDYNLALEQFQQAYKLVENPEMQSYIQFEIGKIYIDSLHLPNRDSLFLNSLKYLKTINRLDGIGYAHILLGKTYLKDGQYELSKENLLEGISIVESIKADYKMQMGYETLIELLKKEKDFENALSYSNRLGELKQRIYDQEKGRYIKDIETKYEVEKKTSALAQTEKEKNTAKSQRNLIGIFVFILAILLIILYIYQRKLKKSNTLLVIKKKEIENINLDLEETINYKNVLLKEVHHRVKNNLQIICSILEMQIDASGSLNLRNKLQTSIDRIFSMALVHEQLYTDDSKETIDAHAYFTDIVDAIVSSQQSVEKPIEVHIHMDELQLNLAIALPLGMILNELITNAFKYAFTKMVAGKIDISLQLNGAHYTLLISDNGSGIDTSKVRKNSIGLQLAEDFTTQVRGDLSFYVDQGTHYKIKFPAL